MSNPTSSRNSEYTPNTQNVSSPSITTDSPTASTTPTTSNDMNRSRSSLRRSDSSLAFDGYSLFGKKRSSYLVSTMSALAIVGTHTLEVQGGSKLIAVTTLYFMWFVLMIAFASLCLHDHNTKDSRVVIVCTYYLLWVIAVMYFLGIAQAGNGDTLFIWTPICVQIGIIPGASILKCVSKVWKRSKVMVSFVLSSWYSSSRKESGAQDSLDGTVQHTPTPATSSQALTSLTEVTT